MTHRAAATYEKPSVRYSPRDLQMSDKLIILTMHRSKAAVTSPD